MAERDAGAALRRGLGLRSHNGDAGRTVSGHHGASYLAAVGGPRHSHRVWGTVAAWAVATGRDQRWLENLEHDVRHRQDMWHWTFAQALESVWDDIKAGRIT